MKQQNIFGDGFQVSVPAEPFQLCNTFFDDERKREAVLLVRLVKSGKRDAITLRYSTPEARDEAVVRIHDLERVTLTDRHWKVMLVDSPEAEIGGGA